MFIFGGYIFDQRARYSFTVWTSAGSASIVVASNIGWQFNRKLTVTGGYTGVPGSRSLVNTFPFFRRSIGRCRITSSVPALPRAPGRTEKCCTNLHYLAFVGNGLNTLNISATKIDTNLLLSGSMWWEPLGRLRSTGQISQHVRRLFLLQENSHSNWHFVYEISRGPFLKPRSIESGEHFTLQFRRRADLLDRSVCAGCHGRRGHVQDVGDRLGPQMERACGQRAILHAVAG